MLRVFEAFSGYGSQSRELIELGIKHRVVGTSEIDPNAIIAYAAIHECFEKNVGINFDFMIRWLKEKNIGYDFKKRKSYIDILAKRKDKSDLVKLYSAALGQKCFGDISLLSPEEIPDMDLFTYSFPCQDISVAGLGKGFDEDSETRSSLLWECRKIIKGKNPSFLMMENVKNIVGKKNKPNFDKWLSWLEGQGYNNYWKVINAKKCGIPQNRERVFVVSIKKDVDDGTFKFEKDFDNGVRLKDILEKDVKESYYVKLEKSKDLIESYIKRYGKAPTEGIGAIRGRDIENPNSRISGVPTKQMLEINNNDTTNTITTVQKDNVVIEKSSSKIEIIGNFGATKHGNFNVYNTNGIGRCVAARDYKDPMKVLCIGENLKIIEEQESSPFIKETENGVEIKEATKQGYKLAEPGDSVNLEQPNSKTRRGRVGKGVAQTLTTSCNQGVVVGEHVYYVRKLTPRECFRLMGLNEKEIDLIQSVGISNSQQYKLAGNSIVKQAMAFLKNLPLKKD